MVDSREQDLEALATALGGLADDVDLSDSSEGPTPDIDVVATLRALADDSGPPLPAAPEEAMPPLVVVAPERPPDTRAAILARARAAKAEKKRRAVQASSGLEPHEAAPPSGAPASSALVAMKPRHIVVPSAVLECIRSGLSAPFHGPHLQSALLGAARTCDDLGLGVDPDVARIVDHLCMHSQGSVETKGALAERLGVKRKTMDALLPAVATSVVVMDQVSRRKHEAAFSAAMKPLMYIDGCRYDETPMAVAKKTKKVG